MTTIDLDAFDAYVRMPQWIYRDLIKGCKNWNGSRGSGTHVFLLFVGVLESKSSKGFVK